MNTRSPFPTDFLLQTEDLIARLDADLSLLREANATGEWRGSDNLVSRRNLFERLFRHTHTLKGTAATFGALTCARLAHEIENALHALRKTPPVVAYAEMSGAALSSDEEIGAALQEAVDVMSVSLRAGAGAQESEIQRAASAATLRLNANVNAIRRDAAARSGETHHADASPEYDLPTEWRTAPLDPSVTEHLREVSRDDVSLFVVTFGFALATFDADYLRCDALLRQAGEIIATRPLPLDVATLDAATQIGSMEKTLSSTQENAVSTPRLRFSVLFAAKLTAEEVSRAFADFDVVVKLVSRDGERTNAPQISIDEARGDEIADAVELVRVPLDALDELTSLVAELHEDTQAFITIDDGVALHATRESNDDTEGRRHALRRRFLEVQDKLLRLRMVTTEARLQEAARAGRVAARACGKSVVWQMAGGDVRLDKSLAENLSTPLAHLVRNAVDHGIETIAERRAAGKPERGTITLRALAGAGRVRIIVADDGRGIEPERVRLAALQNGIISVNQKLTPEDHLRLIFRSGFTTAAAVASDTETIAVSGRGVGLDAAERAIEDIGGELRVASVPGRGTTFEIRLPTTLALVEAVTVGAGARSYCIPSEHILDTIRLDATNSVGTNPGEAPRASWRNRSLPLINLSSLLNLDGTSFQAATNDTPPHLKANRAGLVVRTNFATDDEGCVMLSVEDYEPAREMFVRGLGTHARLWQGVIGATPLAAGALALLLDMRELLEAQAR